MPRDRASVRRRLQQSALELFRARGYDSVTADAIASHAGVTERTFFRHFPDKREALFDGETAMRDVLVDAVLRAPDDLPPLRVLFVAFQSVERMLEDNRAFAAPRRDLIATVPALRERAEAKIAMLNAALADALRGRGVEERLAMLSVQVGMAAFAQAARSWFGDPTMAFRHHLQGAFDDLRTLCVAVSTASSETA